MRDVDRRHAVPLYHQILLLLRDEIFSGARPFDSVLPTEQSLAARHGVSRITARRALTELAGQGLVERRRRTGTRVTYRTRGEPIDDHLDQALESLLMFGRETQVRVLELSNEPADAVTAQRLGISEGVAVTRAVRLRHEAGQPLGEVISYIAIDRGIFLDVQNLATTPILALVRQAGHRIGGGTQMITAVGASVAQSELLDVEARTPLLRIERIVTDAENRPLLLTVASYRADRYRICIDMLASELRPEIQHG